MLKQFRTFLSSTLLLSILAPASVIAMSFTDTPGHLYQVQIEQLATLGVVKGNPDGSFKPDATINRAELLTLLYRAANTIPATPRSSCFKDVPVGEWFSAVVCDAAANGYVGGYPDGTFQPARTVNRVEALKMIHTVLRLSLAGSVTSLTQLSDVPSDAWFGQYVASALYRGILPIAGQTGSKFYPDSGLKRGEAAAYIYNALGITLNETSSSSASSVVTRSSSSSASVETGPIPITVDFPFGDDGSFIKKQNKVYTFSLKSNIVARIDASVAAGGSISCRLYKLDPTTSFAYEYYIGHVVDHNCSMRVALSSGDYQLELTPSVSGTSFTLFTNKTTGDNNDGFREASLLAKGAPKVGYLEQEDFAEFYKFTLSSQQKLTVMVSSSEKFKCLIYPMKDVDLYGFSGPVCNQEYDFPPGTYYVGVQLRDEVTGKESFSVRYQ